ncbi:MAG: hypothetical protein MZV64_47605 [Ignavibacteriales bacterium]|nr:hypothetical protein [Ignavibacteriales bacterium]
MLAGVNSKKDKAIEASLKYFLLGAFATGFISLRNRIHLWFSAQTTSIDAITAGFAELLKRYYYF